MNTHFKYALFFLIYCAAIFGCTKSSLLSSELAPGSVGTKITGPVFIVGVFNNQTTHNIYENSLAAEFEKAGVKAFVSHKFGFDATEPNEDELTKAMEETQASAIFFTHLINEEVKNNHIPPIDDGRLFVSYWDNTHTYHAAMYERVFAPETNNKKTTDFMESSLFDWKSGKRIWTGRSKSVNLDSYLRQDDVQLEDLFIQALKSKKLI